MDVYAIVLRLIHIVCGVFWAGTAFFNVLVLEPAVNASGQEGQKTMGAVMRVGLTMLLGITSGLTMLSGLMLYGKDSSGFQMAWVTSPQGLVLALGAVTGIVGGIIGGAMVGRAGKQLTDLGTELAQSRGKPTDAQTGQMAALKNQIHLGGQVQAILMAP
jgi:hypothetical protein